MRVSMYLLTFNSFKTWWIGFLTEKPTTNPKFSHNSSRNYHIQKLEPYDYLRKSMIGHANFILTKLKNPSPVFSVINREVQKRFVKHMEPKNYFYPTVVEAHEEHSVQC